jgi:hypothetical protein
MVDSKSSLGRLEIIFAAGAFLFASAIMILEGNNYETVIKKSQQIHHSFVEKGLVEEIKANSYYINGRCNGVDGVKCYPFGNKFYVLK